MRAIKVLVVVMGIMIIVGTAVLAMKIMDRMGSKESKDAPASQSENIMLPKGAHIKEIQTHEGQVLLRLKFPENTREELWILNGKKGEVVKKIIAD